MLLLCRESYLFIMAVFLGSTIKLITKCNWSQVTAMSLQDKILSKCIFVLWLGSLLDLRVPLVVREKKAVDR